MAPRCTYRVQLRAGFTFADAAAIAGYLADLGVSHLYCSPYLQACPGSTHGYDVTDPRRLNDELGGHAGHRAMTEALRRVDLGQVLDIVPNHMAADAMFNPWWHDVLARGPASEYARFFDIDWAGGDERSASSVLVPVLGDHYGKVLEAGELRVERVGGELVVRYYDNEFPLSPATTAWLHDVSSVDDELAALNADADRLDALLRAQHYRLAYWRSADEDLDYRRFFNIQSLVGVRVEDQLVFEQTHHLVLGLVRDGTVGGLRIDHVDGLRNPLGYLQNLAARAPGTYTVVEKILGPDEDLPAAWPVAGTSGYDFLFRVNSVFVAGENEAAMTDCYHDFTGDRTSYGEIVHASKHQVMRDELAAEVERLTSLLVQVCDGHRRHRDHTRSALREAVRELAAHFDVYRTYVQPEREASATDRAVVQRAVAGALDCRSDLDADLVAFIGQLALGEHPGAAEADFARRFQQFTAPVMAKGVEDTAFYRYHRLISLNEVGGDPATFGRSVAWFHDRTVRTSAAWPHAMLTLSTHDTKRSADVRARVNVLAEIPDAWRVAVERWSARAHAHRVDGWDDRQTEYLFYQTVVGAWPLEVERACACLAKSTKEAKVHTSWTNPDEGYDYGLERFVRGMLGDEQFVAGMQRFLDDHRVIERGRRNSLAQTALLLTCPGVPDLYQGTELWDLSLVDPDNRRAVDYELRRRSLETTPSWESGSVKQWMIRQLLGHRREHAEIYETADYEPLPASEGVVAFRRGDVIVAVACRSTLVPAIDLRAGNWRDVLDAGKDFPVAVYERD